jgi:hypothetical protein
MRGTKRQPFSILFFDWTNILRGGLQAVVLALAAIAHAEIIDRIAVSVGNSVITASDLDGEIRVTAFLDSKPPDLTAASKRATAERLIEQKLIRREIELSRYPVPDAATVEPAFEEARTHFKSDEDFRRALAEYGITGQDVKDQLLWQLTLLRFIEVRFRPGVQATDQDIRDYFEKVVKPAAEAAHPGEPVTMDDYRDKIEEALTGQRADRELDSWLKETRKRTEIVFHEELFQ